MADSPIPRDGGRLHVGASHPATRTQEMPAPVRLGDLAVADAAQLLAEADAVGVLTLDQVDAVNTLTRALRDRGNKLADLAAFLDIAEKAGRTQVSVAAVRRALR
jgi:hypothetical protein